MNRYGKAVLFTSLPRVGGHSTLTLGLASLFRGMFDEVEIWVKTMPEHGLSEAAAERLREMGCRVEFLSETDGTLRAGALCRALGRSRLRRPEFFLALAMRHLSPLLARASGSRTSVYYHITHDLYPHTVRMLRTYQRFFSRLAFICPATYEQFPGNASATWVPQLSEIPVENPEELIAARPVSGSGAPVFGLIGRLTEAKGAACMLEFARTCPHPCELHVAGSGPFEKAFRDLAGNTTAPCRVKFLGSYDPATRAGFLRGFFTGIDFLAVPSQDEWETLSMAVLEALQHGVPTIVCNSGGLGSFAHSELGPAPEHVVRLIEREKVVQVLMEAAAAGRKTTRDMARDCRVHYDAVFADSRVAGRWKALIDSLCVRAN